MNLYRCSNSPNYEDKAGQQQRALLKFVKTIMLRWKTESNLCYSSSRIYMKMVLLSDENWWESDENLKIVVDFKLVQTHRPNCESQWLQP